MELIIDIIQLFYLGEFLIFISLIPHFFIKRIQKKGILILWILGTIACGI